jgi:hypothetical protein
VHPRTVAALEELEKASWFSRVGIDEGFGTAVVATWPEAMDCCDSSAWDDLQLEALNQYRVCIARRSRERLQLWNDTVDEVKKISRPLVDRKIATVVREHALPEIIQDLRQLGYHRLLHGSRIRGPVPARLFHEPRTLVPQRTLSLRLVGCVSPGQARDLLIVPHTTERAIR